MSFSPCLSPLGTLFRSVHLPRCFSLTHCRAQRQDAREWKWREEEIEQIQRDRVVLVERLVAERASTDHANQQRRLDEVYARRRAEWEESEKQGYNQGLRELRKLTRRRETVERTRADRSAVAAYTDAGSEVYVGAAREGGAPRDAAGERLQVNSRYVRSFRTLVLLSRDDTPGVPSLVTLRHTRALWLACAHHSQ